MLFMRILALRCFFIFFFSMAILAAMQFCVSPSSFFSLVTLAACWSHLLKALLVTFKRHLNALYAKWMLLPLEKWV